MKTASSLTKLADGLKMANQKLDLLVELTEKMLNAQHQFLRGESVESRVGLALNFELDPMTLLTLPMSLRKTVMALYKLEKATANDIAKQTKRLRAVESASANQLVRMGYLKKTRKGRDVYFYLEPPMEMAK